jgi:hypothetical protein
MHIMFGSAHVTGAAGCTPENQIFRNPRLNQTNPKPQMVAAAKVVIVEVEEQPKG